VKTSSLLLNNKVALVTGGGNGIGRSTCLALASHGAAVVVVDRDAESASSAASEISASGGQALAHVADVRHGEEVAAMASAALRRFGEIDILVNNVGDFLGSRKKFLDSDEADWEELYQVNLRHIFLCTRAIGPRMVQRNSGGSIINISTIEAFRAIPDRAVYSAFKGAITQFTKSLAVEVAQHGIRVNAIAPDTTHTKQVDLDKLVPPERRHLAPFWFPLGRFGQPEDVANAAVFLASDLSSFITGTTIHVDGGTLAAGGWYRRKNGYWTNMPKEA